MPTIIAVIGLKLLTIPGAAQTSANGINDSGQIVGQFIDANGVAHGFACDGNSFCQLDYPGSAGTSLLGINNLGQIVGMFTTLAATYGFLYDRGTFSPPLTYPNAGNLTVANGINDRGEIVGVFQDAAPGGHSFYYKAGNYYALDYPGARETAAEDINDNGQIVGDFPDGRGTHGFVFLENAGIFSPPLDYPNTTVTGLHTINNGGQIVGTFNDARGNQQPFLCVAGQLNPIQIPGATTAAINAISDRGEVVGNFQSAGGSFSFSATIPV
jgi:probable HAF family extracellular repeat protein